MAQQRPQSGEGGTWRRLLWFVALWGTGVATIAVVGYGLRAVFF